MRHLPKILGFVLALSMLWACYSASDVSYSSPHHPMNSFCHSR